MRAGLVAGLIENWQLKIVIGYWGKVSSWPDYGFGRQRRCEESGRGLPQSKTLARGMERLGPSFEA